MHTPLFPEWRRRLAALGRRSAHSLRQFTLHQLEQHLAGLWPIHWLSQADEGPFSRERIFTLRLTLECFLWQMLKPKTGSSGKFVPGDEMYYSTGTCESKFTLSCVWGSGRL
jgi:hypothetical protein